VLTCVTTSITHPARETADVRTELIHFRKGTAARTAAAGLAPGLLADGSAVCAIVNCPESVDTADLLTRLNGLFPGAGVTMVDFTDLPAPREGTCCGGACGG